MLESRPTIFSRSVRLPRLLYTYYFVWFLVPSLILLVAMIRAIVLTMHRTLSFKAWHPSVTW